MFIASACRRAARFLSCAIVSIISIAHAHTWAGAAQPEEITVTGSLRSSALLQIPLSVTVVDEQLIHARTARHLEEILAVVPNVNLANGASRGRYFQIRGIGERGQFAEPLNPSVGVIIDGADFSGAASAAMLFDMQQVEVFRGPQSGRYGANALAGLVVLRSNTPGPEPEAALDLETGNYDTRRIAAVLSLPLTDDNALGMRLAMHKHSSDGFISNHHLNESNTSAFDETAIRGRLRWQVRDGLRADLMLAHIDVDNGYDDFSLDNTRITLSNTPGQDRHQGLLGSLQLALKMADDYTVRLIAAASGSDIDYGYDEDWVHPGFHPDEYSAVDRYVRERRTRSLELRALSNSDGALFDGSTDWLLGIYLHERDMDLSRQYTYLAQPFRSAYRTRRLAGFGQVDSRLSNTLTLQASLRYEVWSARYSDSDQFRFDPDAGLWGGRLGLQWELAEALTGYASISRGYKAGGFNADGFDSSGFNADGEALEESLREYAQELAWNYELGIRQRHLQGALHSRLTLFYMLRQDQQVSTYRESPRPGSPAVVFQQFVDNAASGRNYGLEAELQWQLTPYLDLQFSGGLLDTELQDFINSEGESLDGRRQAHAPAWQYHLALNGYLTSGWFARLESEGRDAFYWSDSHNEQSADYLLMHVRAGWRNDHVELAIWSRNLFDKDYAQRGFRFGNDPRTGYAAAEYVQYGAPRVVGVGLRLTR